MTETQLKAMRELWHKTCKYDPVEKVLVVKTGRMAGRYVHINKQAAIEIVNAN